jgi:Gas vesicle synthesis protein GvpL/GvpF
VAEYIYGIVAEDQTVPKRRGIAGGALRLIKSQGLAALVSELREDQLQLGREEALLQASVLEDAMAAGTILPMRFGTVMQNADEVRERLLEPYADSLRAQLGELANKVEVHIRAMYQQDQLLQEVVHANPEIAKLREALRGKSTDATYYAQIRLGELVADAVRHAQESDSRRIVAELAPLATAVEVGEAAHERVAVSASFLLERERLDKFDEAVERIAKSQAERLRVKYTGPLAPQSFVQLQESA